jgi:hypothetical protein
LSRIVFQVSDKKTMETIMVGAQTAKQFQRNGHKSQDDMKDNPKSEVERKTKKKVKFEIGKDDSRVTQRGKPARGDAKGGWSKRLYIQVLRTGLVGQAPMPWAAVSLKMPAAGPGTRRTLHARL